MLRTACAELEADLQDLGVWLGDLWTGRLTVRRAAVLASQLPPGARVWGVDRQDANRSWSINDYWMANLVDAVNQNTWVNANYGVSPGKRSPVPDPVPRPKDMYEKMDARGKMESDARRFRAAYLKAKEAERDGD